MKYLLLCLFIIPFFTGCALRGGCTDIGCSDGASLSFRTQDNRWADGDYELTLVVNDKANTCLFSLPADLPQMGSSQSLSCEWSLSYFAPVLRSVSVCEETRTADSVSQSCTPVEDEYTLEVQVSGTASTMEVRLERDETVVVDRVLSPSYKKNRPNGPGCSPLCRQASMVVDVP